MRPDFKILEVDDSEHWEIVRQFAYRINATNGMTTVAKMSDGYLQKAIEYCQKYEQLNSLSILLREEKFREKWNINVNEQGELI